MLPKNYKNQKKFARFYNRKFITYKKYFTNENLKKFSEKNIKNNIYKTRLFCKIDLESISLNIKNDTKQYHSEFLILSKEIEKIKEKAKRKLKEILKTEFNIKYKYLNKKFCIQTYIKEIINISYSFYKTTYNFFYSEHIRAFCSYSLYNKLFYNFPYRFFKLYCEEENSLFLLSCNDFFKENLVKQNFHFVKSYLTEREIHHFNDDYLENPMFLYLNRFEREFFKKFFFELIQ